MEPYSIADRVKIIQEHYRNGEKVINTYRALRDHFGEADRPNQTTIGRLVRKFETTGSVDDLPKGTRPKSVRTQSNIDVVRESIQTDPNLSVACRSQKLGIPKSSLRRIMQNDLNLHAVITTNMHEIGTKSKHKEKINHQPAADTSSTG